MVTAALLKLKPVSKMEKATSHLFDFEHGRTGAVSAVVDMGTTWVTGGILGYAHGKYGDKADLLGGRLPLNLAVGILGKAAAVASNAFLGGMMAPTLNSISTVGLAAHGFAVGVGVGDHHAAQASLPKRSSVVGEIPPAPKGSFLSPEEISHFQRQR